MTLQRAGRVLDDRLAVTAGLIQHFLYPIYLDGPATWRTRTTKLMKLMVQYTEPYRSREDRPRERKIMRGQHRHTHDRLWQQRS